MKSISKGHEKVLQVRHLFGKIEVAVRGGEFLPELAVVGIGSDLFHADLHPDLWCGI